MKIRLSHGFVRGKSNTNFVMCGLYYITSAGTIYSPHQFGMSVCTLFVKRNWDFFVTYVYDICIEYLTENKIM